MKKYNFEVCTTNPDELFNYKDVDLVFISSRHDTHSEFINKAMKLNKNIFVEKPIAINNSQLSLIKKTRTDNYSKLFHVGYNRRYSPISKKISNQLDNNINPISIFYRISASKIDSDHWIQDADIGGGRIIGEVCHFIDYSIFLTRARIVSVFASSISSISKNYPEEDNVHIQLAFSNGSVATICFLSDGSENISKEYIEIFGDDCTFIIDDFEKLTFHSGSSKKNTFQRYSR